MVRRRAKDFGVGGQESSGARNWGFKDATWFCRWAKATRWTGKWVNWRGLATVSGERERERERVERKKKRGEKNFFLKNILKASSNLLR